MFFLFHFYQTLQKVINSHDATSTEVIQQPRWRTFVYIVLSWGLEAQMELIWSVPRRSHSAHIFLNRSTYVERPFSYFLFYLSYKNWYSDTDSQFKHENTPLFVFIQTSNMHVVCVYRGEILSISCLLKIWRMQQKSFCFV